MAGRCSAKRWTAGCTRNALHSARSSLRRVAERVRSGIGRQERIAPEWLWRGYRLRLSHGRNLCPSLLSTHRYSEERRADGSEQRLGRAALLGSIYHNFTPAQRRKERKRKYKHPGKSPLEVATGAPITVSYLDELLV